ncbi:hypothetical protein BD410DRAFT_537304 [Rickenella mellea]|uniref:Uncharacterized protein n=1 Tax=Rickenella mellea TaxID=50990 RepID=A0A4Y7PTB4_9AGAM|nr:hypothetical protein BD410DRAFT_537304 [Rickenella mellea]
MVRVSHLNWLPRLSFHPSLAQFPRRSAAICRDRPRIESLDILRQSPVYPFRHVGSGLIGDLGNVLCGSVHESLAGSLSGLSAFIFPLSRSSSKGSAKWAISFTNSAPYLRLLLRPHSDRDPSRYSPGYGTPYRASATNRPLHRRLTSTRHARQRIRWRSRYRERSVRKCDRCAIPQCDFRPFLSHRVTRSTVVRFELCVANG